jgi:hypothetical protein
MTLPARATRRALVLVVGVLSTALLGAAGPATAASTHTSIDVTGDSFDCDPHSYVVVSGTYDRVYVSDESASGVLHRSITLTPRAVVLADATGARYRLSGSMHFGVTGTEEKSQQTRTVMLRIRPEAGGGVVDRVQRTQHFSVVDGVTTHAFLHEERSTCQLPTLYL